MATETWQEITLTDQLLEYGSSKINPEFRIFSYLEFKNAGRIYNVAVLSDLDVKLRNTLGNDSCKVHLISGKNSFSGDDYNLLIAVKASDGLTYAVDPGRIGINSEIKISYKKYKSATIQKYLGILIGLVGIPLILLIFGSVMVVSGFFIWRSAEQQRKSLASKIELLKIQKKATTSIPGALLL